MNKKYNYHIAFTGGRGTFIATEDGYGLLKNYSDHNTEKNFIDSNSNIPFFMFIENEKFDKKSYYISSIPGFSLC